MSTAANANSPNATQRTAVRSASPDVTPGSPCIRNMHGRGRDEVDAALPLDRARAAPQERVGQRPAGLVGRAVARATVLVVALGAQAQPPQDADDGVDEDGGERHPGADVPGLVPVQPAPELLAAGGLPGDQVEGDVRRGRDQRDGEDEAEETQQRSGGVADRPGAVAGQRPVREVEEPEGQEEQPQGGPPGGVEVAPAVGLLQRAALRRTAGEPGTVEAGAGVAGDLQGGGRLEVDRGWGAADPVDAELQGLGRTPCRAAGRAPRRGRAPAGGW